MAAPTLPVVCRSCIGYAGKSNCHSNAPCDRHQAPPVCVCDYPWLGPNDECFNCRRLYQPSLPGFDACRTAWRRQLACGPERKAIAS